MFPEYFKCVSRKFQENVKGVSKKFHVTCHSSQLPKQKEGLFYFQDFCYSSFGQNFKGGRLLSIAHFVRIMSAL